MDVFLLDEETDNSVESTVGPVDIGCDYDLNGQSDERIREIVAAEKQMIAELVEDFAKGFDPDSLAQEITDTLPLLSESLFPGSYAHLLIMLLETHSKMETIQVRLTRWLRGRYPIAMSDPNITSITDETFFVTEIEMLRRLLSTLRGEDCQPVYWITSKPVEIGKSYDRIEASIRVVQAFERDIREALEEQDETKTIYSATPVSTERTKMASVRVQRYDCCQASLAWNDYLRTDLSLTVCYQFYKQHIIETNPDKARELGWLPPLDIEIPRSPATDGDLVDVSHWPVKDRQKRTLRLMFRVAQWLGLARGLSAVHLFCDIARYFTIHKPSKRPSDSYIFFMQNLTEIRLCDTSIKSEMPSPFPFDDKQYADKNREFFVDLFKSANDLASCLVERTSFLEKNPRVQIVSPDGLPQRPVTKEIRMITKLPEIRGSLAGGWQGPITLLAVRHAALFGGEIPWGGPRPNFTGDGSFDIPLHYPHHTL